jgi:hypothetical protein
MIIGGLLAAAALLFFWPGDTEDEAPDLAARVPIEEPDVTQVTAEPDATSIPVPILVEEDEDLSPESLEEIAREIELAYDALSDQDIDRALQHFAAAATIDRHDARVSVLAGHVLDALLVEADEAFDNGEWEHAADRLDIARRIARGLYFDPSPIDEIAQKHADMTRFEDVTPDDPGGIRRAVGHAVRVTHTNGEVIFGRLEAFENNILLFEVQSGVDGGGAQFSKSIPLQTIRELRVFAAERPSEIVLGE